MDHTSNDSAWVDRRISTLTADEGWEPDAVGASQRFHWRRERARSGRRRTIWLAPVAVLLAGLVIVAVPATRAAAQRLATLLRIERTEGVRVLPGSPALLMRSFQLEVVAPPGTTQRAADVGAAARLARFTPRFFQAPGLGDPSRLLVSGPLVARLTLDREELQQGLARMRVNRVVPAAWDGAQINVQQSASVTASWPNLTLTQTEPHLISVPDGFDVHALAEIALRIMGLGPEAAQRLATRSESLPAIVAVGPEDQVQEVTVGSSTGTLLRDFNQSRTLQKRILFWTTPDRLFVLTAEAGCAACTGNTDAFVIGLANSVR
jgi:hypothetical protein